MNKEIVEITAEELAATKKVLLASIKEHNEAKESKDADLKGKGVVKVDLYQLGVVDGKYSIEKAECIKEAQSIEAYHCLNFNENWNHTAKVYLISEDAVKPEKKAAAPKA